MELVDDEFVADSEEEFEDEAGDDMSTVSQVNVRAESPPHRLVETASSVEVVDAGIEDDSVEQEISDQRVDTEHSELTHQRRQGDDAVAESGTPLMETRSHVHLMFDKLDRVEAPQRDDYTTQDTIVSASAAADSIHAEDKSGDEADENNSKDASHIQAAVGPRPLFKVGDIVHVAARTWPGINKLGGAGKIAAVIEDESEGEREKVSFLYNVKYMLGGFEKRIEEEYIQDLATALETGARPVKERVFYHGTIHLFLLKLHE
ncbi:hypothetical protein PINS_up000297 [Pythium insidiosum]|nr:hypothetical protein PINS_up000297 [Pythium insidiosum]